MFAVDLHTHSRYARATSPRLDVGHLAERACRKGLSVLGTGDVLHPGWREELRSDLVEAEPGLLRPGEDLERQVAGAVPVSCRRPVRFALSAEVSCVYRRGGRQRAVHHLLFFPDLEAVESAARTLSKHGDLGEDGRPTLSLDSRDLLETVLEASSDAYLIPAHAWTPWFGIFGSRSGFDSLEECFGDLSDRVFAIETGLSSDPPMNRRLSGLDRVAMVSFSDAHSGSKLGREATVLDGVADYAGIRRAFATGEGLLGTVEFFPEEGKYHLDGHRACNLRWHPDETRARGGRCPVCGRAVTVGVLSRVLGLADRPVGHEHASGPEVWSLVPLVEVLSEIAGVGPGSKTVAALYDDVLARLGPELDVLRTVPLERVREAFEETTDDLFGGRLGAGARRGAAGRVGDLLPEALSRMRSGRVAREAGYDGRYGSIRVLDDPVP